jgi:hypothetical protein
MDAFGFHPYPNKATDPLDRGYAWPDAGFVNLDRIKQALWDAFDGTQQPTTLQGLKVVLDEVGWQVGTTDEPGYTGVENVPVTDEATQAEIYGDLVRRAACDPDVAQVSFFGFHDDGSRLGFQAGLARADGSLRPSADTVAEAIVDTAGGCATTEAPWRPVQSVLNARVAVVRGRPLHVRVSAGEDARALVCAGRPGSFRGSSGMARAARGGRCRAALVPGLHTLEVAVPRPLRARRRAEIRVLLRAQANALRRTQVVRETLLRG